MRTTTYYIVGMTLLGLAVLVGIGVGAAWTYIAEGWSRREPGRRALLWPSDPADRHRERAASRRKTFSRRGPMD